MMKAAFCPSVVLWGFPIRKIPSALQTRGHKSCFGSLVDVLSTTLFVVVLSAVFVSSEAATTVSPGRIRRVGRLCDVTTLTSTLLDPTFASATDSIEFLLIRAIVSPDRTDEPFRTFQQYNLSLALGSSTKPTIFSVVM
jgi:hypothetical protein